MTPEQRKLRPDPRKVVTGGRWRTHKHNREWIITAPDPISGGGSYLVASGFDEADARYVVALQNNEKDFEAITTEQRKLLEDVLRDWEREVDEEGDAMDQHASALRALLAEVDRLCKLEKRAENAGQAGG